MATVNFRIKSKASPANIKIRFKQGDKFDVELATGLKTKIEHWNIKQQKVRLIAEATYKDEVNNHLNLLKAFIEKEYLKVSSSEVEINSNWLKDKLDEYFGRKKKIDSIVFLACFIESVIEEEERKRKRKLGKYLSESTLDSYKVVKNKIVAFEKYTKTKVKLGEINLDFHSNFVDYLAYQELLTNNAIGFHIGKLKTICRRAISKGYEVPLDFQHSDFYIPSNETLDVYLTENEIEKIFQIEFDFDSKLDNARDWFVIGLWTGLRVSDLLRLAKESVKGGHIEITSQKTKIPVKIPIHEQVASILDKRLGEFPRKISDVKFNKYIKEVAKKAGIIEPTEGYKKVPVVHNGETIYRKQRGRFPKFELLSSHSCRRSFASNHYGGELSNMTIMAITGHKSEQSFLNYIKITPKEHAQKLQDYWKKKSSK